MEKSDSIKKRIVFLSPSHFKDEMGGAELQIKYIIERLSEKKIYKILYVAKYALAKRRQKGHQLIGIKRRPSWRKYRYEVIDILKLLYILYKIKPHIIYVRVASVYLGYAAIYNKLTSKSVKIIFHVALESDVTNQDHDFRLKSSINEIESKIFKYGIRRSNHIITQAEYQNDLLIKNYCREGIMIPNFHPRYKISPLVSPENETNILWVANMKPAKNPKVFIELAALFSGDQNYVFHMIGKPIKNDWGDDIIREIENSRNIVYHGFQSLDYVNDMMQKSDYFINTSSEEGFPNTFIQAMILKTMIISHGINPDGILSKNRIGIVSDSVTSMKQKIEMYQGCSLKRDALVQNAFEYYLRNHSLENIRQLEALFY